MRMALLTFLLFGSCVSNTKTTCNAKLRGVIDMGSGSTKLNMAQVDTCGPEVKLLNKIIAENSRAVPLEASKNGAGEIGPEARLAALAALQQFREVAKQTALSYKYSEFDLAVVGTHALRTASNKDEFLKQIEDAGFPVRALTQDEEGEAGVSATLKTPTPETCVKDDLLIWDVGGGSAQFTRVAGGERHSAYLSTGSESFRQRMLKFGKPAADPACPQTPDSPNPIGVKNMIAARKLAALSGLASVERLDSKRACVIGIGGVHNKAIAAQVERNWNKVGPCACGRQPNCLPTTDGYSKKELQCLVQTLATKNDCSPEIKGPYAPTAVSSLILVLGFMDRLGYDVVHVRNINMGDYFLTDDRLIKFGTFSVR